MITIEVGDRIFVIKDLRHQGLGAVGCSDNAPHAEDPSLHVGPVQAASTSPSQHGPTWR